MVDKGRLAAHSVVAWSLALTLVTGRALRSHERSLWKREVCCPRGMAVGGSEMRQDVASATCRRGISGGCGEWGEGAVKP